MSIVSHKPTITRKEMEGVLTCLIDGELLEGKSVKTFESSVSSIINMQYNVAVNSSTPAYYLAFKAMEIGSGDEVIMPSFFSPAPLNALHLTGALPVLVDVKESSYTPDPEMIREKITPKTKAIIIGHTFGFRFDQEDFLKIHELNLPIIEDITDVLGLEFEKDIAQSTIKIASLSPGSLVTTGNGAIISTNNSRYFSTFRELRDGSSNKLTFNLDCCLTDFQAAMGIYQLSKLQQFIKRRKDIAKSYYDALKFGNHRTFYQFSDDFTFQSFPIIFNLPGEKIDAYWKKNKIECVRLLPNPLHKHLNLEKMNYPNSERLSNKLFGIPIYPTLTKKEIERISKAISKFI